MWDFIQTADVWLGDEGPTGSSISEKEAHAIELSGNPATATQLEEIADSEEEE